MASVKKQHSILSTNGIVFHSFWQGDTIEEFGELFSVNYNQSLLNNLFATDWDILEISQYKEMAENDSIYIVARKKEPN